ncbi:PKD domain-containing protein, partial [Arsenicibacter rosenii]|uniref:PKD domain-containing protein n=1 Tax=Arsenicibacter rosenii TaxID=1750698 RepID=UPI000A49B70A
TVPLQLTLLSDGSTDRDGDKLTYQWKVTAPGIAPRSFSTPNPSITFDKAGVYTATLTVKDPQGAENSQSVKIIAGNEPPAVAVNLASNQTFFFKDQPIQYAVQVNDQEDGGLESAGAKKINPKQVAMSINYTSEGFDYAEVKQEHRSVDASTQYAVAHAIINQSDCKVCHQIATKSVGPAFTAIASKYKGDAGAAERLVAKIRNGGVGVWGEVAMPGHPAMSVADAGTLVDYILHINDKTYSSLPLNGAYSVTLPAGDNGRGSVLIRAAYTDRGNTLGAGKSVPSQTSEKLIVLRSPDVDASTAEVIKGVEVKAKGMGKGENIIAFNNGYFGFRQIDLTGIQQLETNAAAQRREGAAGGKIEIHIDSPTGPVIGEANLELAPEVDVAKLMAQMEAQQKENARQGGDGAKKPAQPAFNPFATKPVFVPLKKTEGKHDLYFVFKNEAATAIQPLLSMSKIKFLDK